MLVLSLVLPILFGIAAVDRLSARAGLPLAANPCLVVGTGILVGLGVTSMVDYALLVAFAGAVAPLVRADLLLLALATGLAWWKAPSRWRSAAIDARSAPWLVVAAVAIPALVAALQLYQQLLAHPLGGWDATAMWNMKARFIALGGTAWAGFLSPEMELMHPDYPLLLPILVARAWMYAGGTSAAAPMSIAAVYTVALVLVLCGALIRLRDALTAGIGTLLLLATPPLIAVAAAQYADVPLAAYMTASLAFLLCGRATSSARAADGAFLIAGLLAGLAAWTKNEGLLYALVAAIVPLALALAGRERRAATTRFFAYALGALPMLAVVLLFKATVPTPNDLVAGQGLDATLGRLLDVDRHVAVATAMGGTLLGFGDGAFIALVVAAAAVAALAPRRPATGDGTLALAVSLALLAGYYFVFVTTPQDLQWHLGTALDRVVLHVWPAIVLAGLLVGRRAAA